MSASECAGHEFYHRVADIYIFYCSCINRECMKIYYDDPWRVNLIGKVYDCIESISSDFAKDNIH